MKLLEVSVKRYSKNSIYVRDKLVNRRLNTDRIYLHEVQHLEHVERIFLQRIQIYTLQVPKNQALNYSIKKKEFPQMASMNNNVKYRNLN